MKYVGRLQMRRVGINFIKAVKQKCSYMNWEVHRITSSKPKKHIIHYY